MAMTTTESIRHNARVLLPRMRGKPKAERLATYRALSGGPIGVVLAAVASITTCPVCDRTSPCVPGCGWFEGGK